MEAALRRRTECIQRRFRRRLKKTVSCIRCSRLEQKIPVTEFYRVCCACVLFSLGKSMQRMNSRVPFRSQNIFFLRTSEGLPLVSALEFRYCGEILLVDQKQTFDQRTSCITRHDDLPTRSHGAFHCPAPFLRDCKSRGRRRHS